MSKKNGINDLLAAATQSKRTAPAFTVDDLGISESKKDVYIDLSAVVRSPFQPRVTIDKVFLESLKATIGAPSHLGYGTGMVTAIIVREVSGKYELIDGEHRVVAATENGWTKIRADVVLADDRQAALYAFIANFGRHEFEDYEVARGLQMILDSGLVSSKTDLAAFTGIPRQTVHRYLSLLSLPEAIQELMRLNHKAIGTTGGENLSKLVSNGHEAIAIEAAKEICGGRLKESNIPAWARRRIDGNAAAAKSKSSEEVMTRKLYSASVRANAKGALSIKVTPMNGVDPERIREAILQALSNLEHNLEGSMAT